MAQRFPLKKNMLTPLVYESNIRTNVVMVSGSTPTLQTCRRSLAQKRSQLSFGRIISMYQMIQALHLKKNMLTPLVFVIVAKLGIVGHKRIM